MARRNPSAPWVAKAIFAASCAVWVVLSLRRARPPFHPLTHPGFFDLKIYRSAGLALLHGRPIYDLSFHHFAFTYPPFAGMIFALLGAIPATADEVLVTALNLGLLVLMMRWALQLATPARTPRDEAMRAWLTWVGAAAVLWSEPILSALGYGQIDLVIAALVLFDLSRRSPSPATGIAIGVAAGLKLTPIIFVVYLLLGGRPRIALTATAAFVATVGIGFLARWRDSRVYWSGAFLRTSRVTGRPHAGAGPANQSVHGLLMRISPSLGSGTAYVALAIAVGVVGLGLAALALRAGDDGTGFSLAAVTGLLVSPISWTHHWALAIPALVILMARAIELRSGALAVAALLLAADVGSYMVWRQINADPTGVHLDVAGVIAADWYVIAGLATLTVAAAAMLWPTGSVWRRRPGAAQAFDVALR